MNFNFNFQNKKGVSEVFFGKGIFFSVGFIFIMLICIIGFITMPWAMTLQDITFRGFFLLLVILAIIQYCKAIIKVSFDENNMYVKVMRKEKSYPIREMRFIKLIYYVSCGIVTMYIKGKNRNRSYILWAPSFERERYKLFLDMKDYIESKINK